MHRSHQILNLMGTTLAVLNLKTNKSKANNKKQIIHFFLGKQNTVLHQTACEEKQRLGSKKGEFWFGFSEWLWSKQFVYKAEGAASLEDVSERLGLSLTSLGGVLVKAPWVRLTTVS